MAEKIYIVDNGDMFFGTLEQFEDTFGGHGGDEELMRQTTEAMGYSFDTIPSELLERFRPMNAEEIYEALRELEK